MSLQPAEERDGSDFESSIVDLLRHMVIESEGAGLAVSLSPGYSAEGILEAYARKWGVEAWAPLLLARALGDFKRRIGGSATVAAVAPGFFELSLTKREFGEPKDGAYSGNICGVCEPVATSMVRASGIADDRRGTEVGGTIAKGGRDCRLTFALVEARA